MKKYILSIVSILALSACSDLNENPVSLIEQDKFIRTPADLQVLANGAYGLMTSERYWGRALTVTLLLRDDMCQFGVGTVTARSDMDRFIATDTNALVAGFWPQSYAIIATANEAIEGAKKFPNEKPEVINPIIAQAYFYRAFTYYNLVRLFGDIPYIDYVLRDVDQANRIFKTKEADVYNKIIADLEFAKKWLPNTSNAKAKPTKATAASYLASVYLTRATLSFPERTISDYEKAYAEAKFVIDGETTKFGLNLEPNFQDLFDSSKALTLKEPLFTIDYNNFNVGGDAGQGQDYIAFLTAAINDETYTSTGGQSVTVPTKKVFDSFNPKDYRRAVSFDSVYRRVLGGVPYDITKASEQINPLPAPATNSPIPAAVRRPHVAKYSRFAGKAGLNLRTSSNNYATMRYAEVLLIAAEALNELDRTAEALPLINRVRERARNKGGRIVSFPANLSGLTKDDFRKAVIEERRIELAFEFVRWFDIKRLKLAGITANDGVFNKDGFEPQSSFNPSKHYLLPFPQSELALNPNLAPNNPF
jgi:starch-binding outer membrane protein, SusD/RagB family